jgi:hypothetical protein
MGYPGADWLGLSKGRVLMADNQVGQPFAVAYSTAHFARRRSASLRR